MVHFNDGQTQWEKEEVLNLNTSSSKIHQIQDIQTWIINSSFQAQQLAPLSHLLHAHNS